MRGNKSEPREYLMLCLSVVYLIGVMLFAMTGY